MAAAAGSFATMYGQKIDGSGVVYSPSPRKSPAAPVRDHYDQLAFLTWRTRAEEQSGAGHRE